MSETGSVEVLHGGTTYTAAYSVKQGLVHLLTPLGAKAPQPAGDKPAKGVARAMLKELLHERDRAARRL